MNLKLPIGGAAYRIPSHCVTPLDKATPWYLLYVRSTTSVRFADAVETSSADERMECSRIVDEVNVSSQIYRWCSVVKLQLREVT